LKVSSVKVYIYIFTEENVKYYCRSRNMDGDSDRHQNNVELSVPGKCFI